jgi:hypothetical protein
LISSGKCTILSRSVVNNAAIKIGDGTEELEPN